MNEIRTITFGGTNDKPRRYAAVAGLASFPSSWHQQADDSTFCDECGETLTLCFAPRVRAEESGFAGDYLTPIRVRCDCFVAGSPRTADWTQKLKTEPIPVILVDPPPVDL